MAKPAYTGWECSVKKDAATSIPAYVDTETTDE